MPITFTVSADIPGTSERLYNAWLNTAEHTAMTGVAATAGANVGDTFTAHGGYASGKNIMLEPYSKIVQSWRTTEFDDEEEDSMLVITFEGKGNNTLVTITHSKLPPHGARYKQGWIDYYFEPMIAYFAQPN